MSRHAQARQQVFPSTRNQAAAAPAIVTPSLGSWFALAPALLAGFGAMQHVGGWFAVRHFCRQPPAASRARPPISILKPLHGDEPLLEPALASFCAQDYPEFQIVFGVRDAADPALAVVQRVAARFPRCDLAVVVDPTPHGPNRKVANLMNMLPSARHPVLLIADADVHAAPDLLERVAAALAIPGIGLVTTLYTGLPARPALSCRLGATQITHVFLPGVLIGRALGRQDCLGATMALRRETLEAIGGFPSLVGHLADDAVLGMLVRGRGLGIGLAQTVPATTVAETTLPALFRHELRWARTMRSLAPAGYTLSVLQYPLFWAALAVLLSGFAWWALALFAAAWVVRVGIARGIDRALGLATKAPVWLLPLRDLMSITVILASFASDRVEWRGEMLRVDRPGNLARRGRGAPQADRGPGDIAPP